jgi:uncharacterized protein (DUF4415 family)
MKKLTDKQQAELKALSELKESDINLEDIPEFKSFDSPTIGKFYRPIKKPVTIRLDADVLQYFKNQGSGYQTKINEILRNYYIHKQA